MATPKLFIFILVISFSFQTYCGEADLYRAILGNDQAKAIDLVNKEEGLHYMSSNGKTVLSLSIIKGMEEIVTLILKKTQHQSLIEIADQNGNTPIMHAALYARDNIFQQLIQNEANITKKNNKSQNILMLAVTGQNTHILTYLMSTESDFDLQDNFGDTLLHYASRQPSIDVFNMVLARIKKLDTLNSKMETPLALAAKYDYKFYIENLLANNPNLLELADSNGNTPLYLAALKGNEESFSLLLKSGANITHKNNMGLSLNDLISLNGLNNIAFILDQYLNNQQTDLSRRLLLSLKSNKPIEIIRELIEHKADVNYQDEEGVTPLMIAAENANLDIIKLLLENNANKNITDIYGLKAIDYAANTNVKNFLSTWP